MPCTSILRLGGPPGSEVPISILKKELSSHFISNENDDNQDCDNTNLLIQNKYFHAHIRLLLSSTQDQDQYQDQSAEKDMCEDGIILVFPSSVPINSLTECHTNITHAMNCGDTLRLCISASFGSSTSNIPTKEYEKHYSDRVHWCLDHGYEYIEVDLSEDGLKSGFDEREKDGFARVVEALGGAVWSSAVMKAKKREVKVQPRSPMVCQASEEVEKVAKTTKEPDEIIRSPATIEVQPEVKNTGHEELKESDDNDLLMDNFEKVLNEAKKIRDDSRNGKFIDDDERRQRAADAAEMLFRMMIESPEESAESSDED